MSAELGITVTTTGLKEAVPDLANLAGQAGKTEAAVTSLGQATAQQSGQAGAAITKFTQAANTQFQQSGAQADTYAARIEKALNIHGGGGLAQFGSMVSAQLQKAATEAEQFQARINRALNVKTEFNTESRGADIAAYGAELDRLRNRYVPLAAAETQHLNSLSLIRNAHMQGAISADEMTDAINRETMAFMRLEAEQLKVAEQAKQAVAQRGLPAQQGQSGTNNQAGTNRMMQTNLMYQLQDIAVTSAMGMNPAMIALQQGTQLAAGMQMMGGAKEGVMGLVGALKSMFSWSSILPIAIIGIGAAFYQWVTSSKKGVETLDEAMKKHSESIRILDQLYGEAAASAKLLFTTGGQAYAEALAAVDVEQLQKQLKEVGETVTSKARGDEPTVANLGLFRGEGIEGVTEARGQSGFAAFQPALDKYLEQVRQGSSDTSKLFEEIDRLVNIDPAGLMTAGESLKLVVEGATDLKREFAGFEDPINRLNLALKEGTLTPELFREIADETARIGVDTDRVKNANDLLKTFGDIAKVSDALLEGIIKRDAIGRAATLQELQQASQRARTDDERIEAIRALTEEQQRYASELARTAAIDRAVDAERERIDTGRSNSIREQKESFDARIISETNEIALTQLRGSAQDVLRQKFEAIAKIEKQMADAGVIWGSQAWDDFQKLIAAAEDFYNRMFGIREEIEAINRGRTAAQNDAQIAAMFATTDAGRIASAREGAIAGKPAGPDTTFEGNEAARIEAARIEKEHADATKSRTQALDDLLKKQELEIALIGKTAGEQAALHEEFRLMQEYKLYALEHGIEMDQKVLDLIHAQTQAYGEQVDVLNQKKLIEDLMFERSLIGLSAEEAGIASRLRDTGLSTTGPEADMMRENAAMERAAADREDWSNMGRDSARDFLGSMVDAIVEGGDDMGEALVKAIVGAAQRTLDKIIDKLLDQIINALFGVPGTGGAAGAGGSGGLVGDVISDIFGTGTGGAQGGSSSGGILGAVINGFNPSTAAAAGLNPANFVPGGWGAGGVTATGSDKLGLASFEEMVAFAENAARVRNIDVSTAIKLMKHEGLQPGTWQSNVGLGTSHRETSYGAMQLLKGGGLGDAFERQTGLKVSDPNTWRQNIEFGLNEVARKKSWGDWMGRGPAGIGINEGLANARQVPLSGLFGGGGGAATSAVGSQLSSLTSIVGDAGTTQQGIPLTEIMVGAGKSFKVATAYSNRFAGFLKELEGTGYKIGDVGEGGYSFRTVKGSGGVLSKHSFGEAIDINPAKNPWASSLKTDMPEGVGAMAKKWGLKWGGEWNKPDAMHFQVDKSLEGLDSSIVKATESTMKSSASLLGLTNISEKTIGSMSEMAGGMDNLGQMLSSFSASPSGGGSGWFGGLSKLFGGSGGAISSMMSISPLATMNILSGGGGLYHEGNVGVSSRVTRHLPDMSVFNDAPRFHNGNTKKGLQLKGFASDEYPAILRKGELVFPDKAAVKKYMMPEIINDVWGKAPRFHDGNTKGSSLLGAADIQKAIKDGKIETDRGIVAMLASLIDFTKEAQAAAKDTLADDPTIIRYTGEYSVNKYGELVDKKGKLVWGTSAPLYTTPEELKADPKPGGWDMGEFMRTFENAPKLHGGNVMGAWMNAPRLHNGNAEKFKADEYPAVLRRGEPVFPSMAAAQAAMGGNAFVNVHNYSGAKVTTQQTKDNKGMTIDVMVDRLVATQIDQRGTASNNAIRSKFAVTERLRPR